MGHITETKGGFRRGTALLALLILLMPSAGCRKAARPASQLYDVEIKEEQPADPDREYSAPQPSAEDSSEIKLDLRGTISLIDGTPVLLEDDMLLYAKINRYLDDTGEHTDCEYFIYDCTSGTHRSAGVLSDVRISGGDYLYAPNGRIYFSWQMGTEEKKLSLYELDPERGEIRAVYESASSLPFLFLSMFDEESILLFEPDQKSALEYAYRIKVYQITTEEVTLVLETAFSNETGEGEQIISTYAYEGNIWLLLRKSDGEYELGCLCPATGELSRVTLEGLRESMTVGGTEYGAWRIHMSSGVVWVETLADKICCFRTENGKPCEEALPGYSITSSFGRCSDGRQLVYKYGGTELLLYLSGGEPRRTSELNLPGKSGGIQRAFFGNDGEVIVIVSKDDAGTFQVFLYRVE